MKSYHTVVWWGLTPKVKGNLIQPSRCVTLPSNTTRGVWNGWNLSLTIFILSNAEINKMSAELPLLTKILCTLKLAIVAEMTNSSSWGRCKPLKSSLVKVMGWWASIVGAERLYTSYLASPLAFLACLFRDELEHPLGPNPPWIVRISLTVGQLSPYFLSSKSGCGR